jgi:hypothetical protein
MKKLSGNFKVRSRVNKGRGQILRREINSNSNFEQHYCLDYTFISLNPADYNGKHYLIKLVYGLTVRRS